MTIIPSATGVLNSRAFHAEFVAIEPSSAAEGIPKPFLNGPCLGHGKRGEGGEVTLTYTNSRMTGIGLVL